jgi:hypothetical protein
VTSTGEETDAPPCELLDCPRRAETVVAHPLRPEDRTAVCERHAVVVVDDVGGEREGSV